MEWIWQQQDWPQFAYDLRALAEFERQFVENSGVILGAFKHVGETERDDLIIHLVSTEALKTSEIEGEMLNRASVQSSIRRNFGLSTPNRRATPVEQGIADMMSNLYKNYAAPLTQSTLFKWHKLLMGDRKDLRDIGHYRSHTEPMQIVSGADYAPRVHFEAPPSSALADEMQQYFEWFNTSHTLPALARAGTAHFYFECIHPFEDANGRIGRALAEKSLSQSLKRPALISLSQTIEANKKTYYQMLERYNHHLEITDWLCYFAETVLEAQRNTLQLIDFIIAKTRFYDRFRDQMNARQARVVARMFREGPQGFKGGLSAQNYLRITGTSRPTATRDLADLVARGMMTKTGERRHTRYRLALGTQQTGGMPR